MQLLLLPQKRLARPYLPLEGAVNRLGRDRKDFPKSTQKSNISIVDEQDY